MFSRHCIAAFTAFFLVAGTSLSDPGGLTAAAEESRTNGDSVGAENAAGAPLPEGGDSPRMWGLVCQTLQRYLQIGLFHSDGQVFRAGQLVWALFVFLLILLGVWIGRKVLRKTILRHLRRDTETSKRMLDDLVLTVAGRTQSLFVVLLAAYFALMTLPLSAGWKSLLNAAAIILLTVQVAIWSSAAFVGMIDKEKRRRVEIDPSAAAAFGLLGFFVRVGVWSAAVLLVLTNLGYQIGPLLAGLGVGGVAVAFALQSILGDIFCSIAIVLDKPFVLGDFIVVGDFMGSVENIGIKTTRLRSISGEQIVFSNADLLGGRVRNFKRMQERRVVFVLGVVYETPIEKLRQIPKMVREIIEPMEQARFDRAHFKEFGDFALKFEVVYYVLTPDYAVYMDIQQNINLAVAGAFEEQGIAFAYPTQEVILRSRGGEGSE